MLNLEAYRQVVGDEIISEIYKKARKFKDKHIVCISSTHVGGGVAEMLNSLVFLFNEAGIDFGWRIIHGSPDFFNITKGFHNALQSGKMELTDQHKKIYMETNKRFSMFTHLKHDLVIVHDPQPAALINFYPKRQQPWIWRCHIDLTNPNPKVWNYLKGFVNQYDGVIVSSGRYKRNIAPPQNVIRPAINPLSRKNCDFEDYRLKGCLEKDCKINLKKPIIAQISRFDKWKDPEGVIKVFEKVRKKVDCQLVLLGNIATDDPEGIEIYNELIKKYRGKKDITILVNVDDNDFVVNALQRKAAVVIQKSIKEGFGLTVTEALWKSTPVVASNVGGIPLQIVHGETGYLHEPHDYDAFANSIIKLLKDKPLRDKMGKNAKEFVRKHFLITKLMLNWLNIFEKYIK